METNYNENNIIRDCFLLMYGEDIFNDEKTNINLDDLIQHLTNIPDSFLTERITSWLLNTFNFVTLTKQLTGEQIVAIERSKLELLSKFLTKYSFYKAIFDQSQDPALNEVIFENEYGAIFKRYLPSLSVPYTLPEEGFSEALTIRGATYNDKEFDAEVEIDSKGYTTKILSEPSPIPHSDNKPLTFDSIYSELYNKASQFELKTE